jgi:hypothetical protein
MGKCDLANHKLETKLKKTSSTKSRPRCDFTYILLYFKYLPFDIYILYTNIGGRYRKNPYNIMVNVKSGLLHNWMVKWVCCAGI